MRVDRRELALWSFLMSTAHGAGLMIAPVLIGAGGAAAEAADHHELAQGRARSSSTSSASACTSWRWSP